MPDLPDLAPGITAIIPTYKRVADLGRCLAAMDRQRLKPAAVLITYRADDTETVAYLARRDRPALQATLLLCEQPGVVYALSKAIDHVRTKYLAITDDDSIPHHDWLERIVAHFEADPQAAGVGGKDHTFVDNRWINDRAPEVGMVLWSGQVIGRHNSGFGPARYVHILKGVNIAFRREALGDLRLDRRLRGSGAQVGWEMHLTLTLIARGHKILYDPLVLVDHFPGERPVEEDRVSFNAMAHREEFFNKALVLMEFLGTQPQSFLRRASLLAYLGLRGTRKAPGVILMIYGLLTGYPNTWARFKATSAAHWGALRAIRSRSD